MTRRKMAVEDAVRWAYREELPKAGRDLPIAALGPARASSPGELVDMVAESWALPDNGFGLVVDQTATEEPHPDALIIHEAVTALDAIEAEIPEDWGGLFDVNLHGLEATVRAGILDGLTRFDASGQRVLRISVSNIVRTAAIIGLPDMVVDEPELRVVTGANGKPRWFRRISGVDSFGLGFEAEVDGFDLRRRRPYPDAYQKHYLDPDPVPGLVNRARAELWRAAMDCLEVDLAGMLIDILVIPCTSPLRPWEAGGRAVWPDLTTPRWKLVRHRTNRPLAGPVWKGRVGK